ncbi:MAG: baseplate J/gp47 family protein [Desulfovibrionaceae bacterium]
MSGFTAIDLSSLTAPDAVEALDYETILAGMLADLVARDETFTALTESDPAMKVLEVAAYRELLLRQRVNEAVRAVLVAFATGSDLDQLAALVPLTRLVIDPGDPDADPAVAPTYESDAAFRVRVQLAPEAFSSAGSTGAYRYHALTVAAVLDAVTVSPSPGNVSVYVLARDGDGTPDDATLAAVAAVVGASDVRPLTDNVTVLSAEIVSYAVEANLVIESGPDAAVVAAAAQDAALAYAAARHVLGARLAVSGLVAALHVEGVARVELTSPVGDVVCAKYQAPACTGVSLTAEVADE